MDNLYVEDAVNSSGMTSSQVGVAGEANAKKVPHFTLNQFAASHKGTTLATVGSGHRQKLEQLAAVGPPWRLKGTQGRSGAACRGTRDSRHN